ncbi:MAG: hypothetical protein BA869_04725 [Desulfuromonadales bacterium C00003107]|nr:MAG: hypothetical protein BA869_04725 [Desulfuromonadales bacterium C00003107]
MTAPRIPHITEIIDIEALGELFQHLSNLTDITTAVLDLEGNILIATNWQDICTKFHRNNPATAAHCLESDTILAGQLEAGQKYNVYRCKNGLIDIAVPIVVDNVHIGNLFTGQFFFEKPDCHYFEQQALEFDFDREAYLEALSRVPVFTRKDIEQTIGLLCKMAQIIGETGLNKLRLTETNRELVTANAQLQEEVSDREQAERALRESEEQYRTLFSSSRDAIVILSPSGRFVDGNPTALQLFGCQNIEEFINKTPADLSPEHQPDGVLSLVKAQEMAALVMEEGSHFFEWKHQRINGEEFFATVLLTKMHLQNKVFLQATVRDVTESKLAEEKLKRYQNHLEELVAERTAKLDKANQRLQQDILLREEVEGQLRESQQMLQLVLDYIPQHVFWKDRDSVYLGCNRNFARAAGVEAPQKLVGKTDYDLAWKKEETDFYRECDRRVMESDTPELHIIESQRQADGKQAWLDTNRIPLHDGEGRVVGILGTFEDITERKLAEERDQQYRAFFENNCAVLILVDPESAAIVDANSAACSFYGYSKEELIQMKISDINTLPSDQIFQEMERARSEQRRYFQFRHRLASGSVRDVEVFCSPHTVSGKSLLFSIVHDITERKQAEKALRESEERLKEANRGLEAFAYTVSHDLRTPLTVILGYAELLQKSLQDRLDKQELNCLSVIYDAGIRMVELMEDLLSLAKAGQIERPAEPSDTVAVVNDVVCGLAEIITQAGVTVVVGDLPTLRLPKTLLVQVFHNLIANAIRYGCKPGDVIEVEGERKGAKVRFYVRDYGPGVPAEERGRIFEVFYRGTTGNGKKGTGIGLATVQKIARLFDGRAWVEETAGGGSTFCVEMVDVPVSASIK